MGKRKLCLGLEFQNLIYIIYIFKKKVISANMISGGAGVMRGEGKWGTSTVVARNAVSEKLNVLIFT